MTYKPTQCPVRALMMIVTFTITLVLGSLSVVALPEISLGADETTLTVEDAPEMQVIAVSKNVIIRKHVKEVLVWGGDVIVEGRVEGDVAAIGGSVIHKESGYIGGDVIVFGGEYRAEGPNPLRGPERETIMFGMFEDELRSAAQDPASLLSPSFTPAFAAQRILSALFWFIVTFGVATIAPGAVGRATARFRLNSLRITAIGVAAFVGSCIGVVIGLAFLPEAVSAVVGLMAFVLLMLAYGFGRVALHVSAGKALRRWITPNRQGSEALAILLGVVSWTVVLSLPYAWPIGVFALFSVGVGLVLTARANPTWATGLDKQP